MKPGQVWKLWNINHRGGCAQGYDAVYAGVRTSPTLQRLWREHVLFEISATLDSRVIQQRVFVGRVIVIWKASAPERIGSSDRLSP